MKGSIIFFLKLLPVPVLLFISMITINAQDKKDKNTIANAVGTKNYVFVAQTAQPASGSLRQLTSTYQLEVKGDTVTADLPYFGRAYTAPVDPSRAGIDFTSSDVEYTNTPRKKGGWSILIKPKGNVDARQLILDISANGYANLQVISNSRQSISFSGYVQERKLKQD
jgi:hypothetical protein